MIKKFMERNRALKMSMRLFKKDHYLRRGKISPHTADLLSCALIATVILLLVVLIEVELLSIIIGVRSPLTPVGLLGCMGLLVAFIPLLPMFGRSSTFDANVRFLCELLDTNVIELAHMSEQDLKTCCDLRLKAMAGELWVVVVCCENPWDEKMLMLKHKFESSFYDVRILGLIKGEPRYLYDFVLNGY